MLLLLFYTIQKEIKEPSPSISRHMKQLLFAFFLLFLISCKQEEKADPAILTDAGVIHRNIDQLTKVIVHDVFSPPVTSRIYSYTNIAAYEALRHSKPGYPSLASQMHGFENIPQPEAGKEYNYLLAASKAFFTMAEKVTFSVDTLRKYEDKLFADYKSLLDKETYERSMDFGEKVGLAIFQRSTKDNYKETRGMPKFLGSVEIGKWRPTPPDYLEGAEPHWSHMLPLTMDSSMHFSAMPPPLYSTDTSSLFYQVVKEVYTVGKNLTPEQINIAKYWDDNPIVMEHSGHMMFGNKKINPVGHWIGITSIASRKKNLEAVEAAQLYALVSSGIYDGIIGCWEEKYKSQMIRPITVINEFIDPNWQPLIQTPPFPEHTSGHSTISAVAATILTKRLGENFAFEDTSDLAYIGMKRNFKSFMDAAWEASVSRLYGGIHYRTGIEEGTKHGIKIGEYVNSKIKTHDEVASVDEASK